MKAKPQQKGDADNRARPEQSGDRARRPREAKSLQKRATSPSRLWDAPEGENDLHRFLQHKRHAINAVIAIAPAKRLSP
jgi:hypothetical protein